MAPYRFIDVTGIGNSGKSACVDFLREFEGVLAPEFWFEFDVIRTPNGLADLRRRLVEEWSPMGSHFGIRSFIELTERMGLDPPIWDIAGQMKTTGQRLDRRFRGEFTSRSRALALSMVKTTYRAEWYDEFPHRSILRPLVKLLRRMGIRNRLQQTVFVADGRDFDGKVKAYVADLYRLIAPAETHTIVFNNAIEPYAPERALDMLDAKQIVVTRDPRDIYVSGLNLMTAKGGDRTLLAPDNKKLNKSFLGSNSLRGFVAKMRVQYDQLPKQEDPRVLRIHFEDLVQRYEETSAAIVTFAGLSSEQHARPRAFLAPERSIRNIGLWRRYSKQDEIRYIEDELRDHLVQPS